MRHNISGLCVVRPLSLSLSLCVYSSLTSVYQRALAYSNTSESRVGCPTIYAVEIFITLPRGGSKGEDRGHTPTPVKGLPPLAPKLQVLELPLHRVAVRWEMY